MRGRHVHCAGWGKRGGKVGCVEDRCSVGRKGWYSRRCRKQVESVEKTVAKFVMQKAGAGWGERMNR